MGCVSDTISTDVGSATPRPAAWGTLWCALSAAAYVAANICLRRLTVWRLDSVWIIWCKETVTAMLVAPVLLAQAARGRRVLPPPKMLALLLLTGLTVVIGGDIGCQWALGVVGLAAIVPLNVGTLLIASAAMGALLLGEAVSPRTAVSLGLLVLSVAVLSVGAGDISRSVALDPAAAKTILAVALVGLAGVIYAALGAVLRRALTSGAPLGTLVFLIPFTGTLILAPIVVCRLGWRPLAETTAPQYAWMAAAGVCNLVGFLAINKGLQSTTLVRANTLSASQVAMAALAGVLLFKESPSVWLSAGVCLTIAGILLMDAPSARQAADQHV